MTYRFKTLIITCLLYSFCYGYNGEYDQCFYGAGTYYNIDYRVLKAIAKVESGFNPYAINVNKNRTVDIGIMQINSSWLNRLSLYGINQNHLYNPCYNIYLGAWILRQCINKYGNTWKSIDCYNKGTRARENSLYVWKVYKELQKQIILTYAR